MASDLENFSPHYQMGYEAGKREAADEIERLRAGLRYIFNSDSPHTLERRSEIVRESLDSTEGQP